METILINAIGKARRATLSGRDYLVAPVTLIVPGVLNGSLGPLFYPPDELAKNPSVWNGVPIVLGHPSRADGTTTTAKDPDVLNKTGLGTIFGGRFEGGKLKAEAWFDIESTRRLSPSVLTSLLTGRPVESSTGLGMDMDPVQNESSHEGTRYTFVARNYRPDHVAVLTDQTGACSVQDGCGVLMNQEGESEMKLADKKRRTIVDGLIANGCCWEEDDRDILNGFADDKLTAMADDAKKTAGLELVANAASKGFKDQQGNSHTFDEKTGKWATKVKETEPAANEGGDKKPVTNEPPAKPKTIAEFLAESPPEVQEIVKNAMAVESRERAELIGALVAPVEEGQRESVVAVLNNKPLEELRTLQALLPKAAGTESVTAGMQQYVGPGAPSSADNAKFDEDAVLNTPVINWKTGSKEPEFV
jgi:hypothetical protein